MNPHSIGSLFIIMILSMSLYSQKKTEQKYIFKDLDGKVISKEVFQKKYKDTIIYSREYTMTRENGKSVFTLQPKSAGNLNQKLNQEFIKRFSFKKMPEFNITDVNGINYDNESLKGKKVVLNFWFAKCAPCIKEIPELNRLVKKYSNNSNVVFIAITFDNQDTNKVFLNKTEFKYNQVVDQKELIRKMGVVNYPTNMVIDEEGKIIFIQSGYVDNIKDLIDEKLK